jgi:hypothetical protein
LLFMITLFDDVIFLSLKAIKFTVYEYYNKCA